MLNAIAVLLRENPAITVRELASRLGYSEAKSIYYWLEKGGYHGIKSFRQAVLRGDYPPEATAAVREPVGDHWQPAGWPEVRVIEKITPAGEPVLGPGALYLPWPLPQASVLSLRWPNDDYAPFVQAGDQLLLEREGGVGDGDLILVQENGAALALRRVYLHGQGQLWVHPLRPRLYERRPGSEGLRLIARIFRLLRDL